MHLLGYGLPLDDPRCSGFLVKHREYLVERCERTLARLSEHDLNVSLDQVLNNSNGNPPMPPHVLKALADNGYFNDIGTAVAIFNEYLSFGGKAWVDHETSLAAPLEMLIDVGAKAIVAHPFRFPSHSWLEDILDMGAHGFELYYPDHNGTFFDELSAIWKKRDCLITGGCDFHGAFAHRIIQEVDIPMSVGINFMKALGMEIPSGLSEDV